MTNVWALKVAVAGIMIAAGVGSVAAQDWPQWRGPNRDGKLAGFVSPQNWPKELTWKWKVAVGKGDSTPALVAGRLYAFGRFDANEVVRCLDAATGNVLWQDTYPANFMPDGPSSSHPGPRATPAVADGKVCVLGVGAILSCLDAATGKLLWRKQSDADYLGTPCRFESSTSPMIVDGLCITHVGGDGKGSLIAFDLATGQPKWVYRGDGAAPASPVLMTVDGDRHIVTFTETSLIGVRLADRTLAWQVPFQAKPANSTTPVIDGSTVIVTGQGVGTLAFKVARKDGGFTASPLWSNTDARAGSYFTTPVLRDGLLFGYLNSKLACLSARTGEILWSDTTARGHTAALVDAGACLMALSLKGDLVVYRPADTQYVELACYKVAEPELWAHPVIAGKNIYIRDADSITLWTIE